MVTGNWKNHWDYKLLAGPLNNLITNITEAMSEHEEGCECEDCWEWKEDLERYTWIMKDKYPDEFQRMLTYQEELAEVRVRRAEEIEARRRDNGR